MSIRAYRLLLAILALTALAMILGAASTGNADIGIWTARSALVVVVAGFFLVPQKLK